MYLSGLTPGTHFSTVGPPIVHLRSNESCSRRESRNLTLNSNAIGGYIMFFIIIVTLLAQKDFVVVWTNESYWKSYWKIHWKRNNKYWNQFAVGKNLKGLFLNRICLFASIERSWLIKIVNEFYAAKLKASLYIKLYV